MRPNLETTTAATSRRNPSDTSLYLSYGPEGKGGRGGREGAKQAQKSKAREESLRTHVVNVVHVVLEHREETLRVHVLNVLMSWSLLKFSAETPFLGGLAGHGQLGVGEHSGPPAGAGHRNTYRKLSDRAAHCHLVQCSGTFTPKAKAPVCRSTLSEAVATPTEKRGFVMSKFWGLVRLHLSRMVYGRGGGYPQGRPHDFGRATNRHAHPMHVVVQKVVLATPEGAKTMTVSTQASRRAAPILPTTGNTHHHDPIQLHMDAVNAASMARWYAARHDYAAAFRKSAQATGALRRLSAFERLEVTA